MTNNASLSESWRSLFTRPFSDLGAENGIYSYFAKAGYPAGWDIKEIFQLILEEDEEKSFDYSSTLLSMRKKLMNALNDVANELSLDQRLSKVISTLCNICVQQKMNESEVPISNEKPSDVFDVREYESQLSLITYLQEVNRMLNESKERNAEHAKNIESMKQEEKQLDQLLCLYNSKIKVSSEMQGN